MTRRRVNRAVLALAVVVHLVVLYWPRAPGTGGVPLLDKAVHALVFGVVLWAARRAGFPARSLVLLLVAHAAVSEAVQGWLLPGRSGDLADVLADLAGVAATLALVRVTGSAPEQASWRDERARSGGSGGG